MNLDWLQVCADGQTTPCVAPIQVVYLVALIVGAVLLAIIGRRSRDFTTSVLSLMAVAIAINIAVGSIIFALRLPIYLDSIGTVLVGALAGPWAGALTGILSNLIWSILPIPGGAEPDGRLLRPGRGRHRPDGRLLGEPGRLPVPLRRRAGRRLPVAGRRVRERRHRPPGRPGHGRPGHRRQATPNSQNRFVVIGLAIIARSASRSPGSPVGPCSTSRPTTRASAPTSSARPRSRRSRSSSRCSGSLFGPNGYFSAVNGKDPDGDGPLGPLFGGADLSFLALPRPGRA